MCLSKKTSRTYDSRHFETRTCTVGRRSGVGYATTVRRPTMTQIPTVEWPSSTLMIPNKSNDRRQVTVELWRRPSGDGRHSTWYRPLECCQTLHFVSTLVYVPISVPSLMHDGCKEQTNQCPLTIDEWTGRSFQFLCRQQSINCLFNWQTVKCCLFLNVVFFSLRKHTILSCWRVTYSNWIITTAHHAAYISYNQNHPTPPPVFFKFKACALHSGASCRLTRIVNAQTHSCDRELRSWLLKSCKKMYNSVVSTIIQSLDQICL